MATVKINQRAIADELNRVAVRHARIGAHRARDQVRSNIASKPRVDTGKMMRSVGVKQITPTKYRVHSGVFYTMYQEFGTRAHGPRTAKVMRFKPKGSGKFVFATWVRGVTPGRFFSSTPGQMTLRDFLT